MRMILLCFVFSAGALAAPEPRTLERLMGPDSYRAMGLDKLTPAERELLLRWVLERSEIRTVYMGSPSVTFRIGDSQEVPAQPVPPEAATSPAAPAVVTPARSSVTSQAEVGLFGIEQTEGPKPAEFRARLVGEFTGWTGKTEFVLDNGQVWRQSTSGTYRHRETAPEVMIERGAVGYKLRLMSTRRSINVRRVK